MNNAQLLIERLRRKLPRPTNYAIAKELEMNPSQLARVVAGEHGLGPKAVIRLHELLGMDARDLLVLIEEDKAKTPTDKEFWSRRSPRISASLSLAVLAFGLAGLGQDAQANTTGWTPSVTLDKLYIIRRLRKALTSEKRPFSRVYPRIRIAFTDWARQPPSRLSLLA